MQDPAATLAQPMDPPERREWQFLNITEPMQSREEEFQKYVKTNASKDYKRRDLKRRTQQYAEAKMRDSAWKAFEPATTPGLRLGGEDASQEASIRDAGGSFVNMIHSPQKGTRRRVPRRLPVNEQHASFWGHDAEVAATQRHLMKNDEGCRQGGRQRGHELIPAERVRPRSYLGAGMIDPFETCQSAGQPKYHELLNHFIAVFAPSFLPVDKSLDQNLINGLWVSHSLASPVLSNAILACAAVHLNRLLGRVSGVEAVYYMGKSISLLNKALQSLDTAVYDPTIGAVGLLVATENVTGNIHEILLHLGGMKKIVTLRGGLSKVGWGGTLRNFISWLDLISSVTTDTQPKFQYEADEPLQINEVPEPRTENYFAPTLSLIPPNSSISQSGYRNDLPIFSEMRHLIQLHESFKSTHGGTAPDYQSFSKKRLMLEHRLFSAYHQVPFPLLEPYIEEACRTAVAIYINSVLHEFDPVFGVVEKLTKRMKKIISCGQVTRVHREEEDGLLLMWALFIGGQVSDEAVERDWFGIKISVIIKTSRLKSRQEVEGCLIKVFRTTRMHDASYESLWISIQRNLNIFE